MKLYRLSAGSSARSTGASLLALFVAAWALTNSASVLAQPGHDEPEAALFELAERKLPDLFPPGPPTRKLGQFHYRYYPGSGTYLAVALSRVWLLGGEFGEEPVEAGRLEDILAILQELPDVTPTRWTLTVSGTVYYGYGSSPEQERLVFRNFQRLMLTGLTLPDLVDTELILGQLGFSLAGEVSGITVLFRHLVYDLPDRKALALTFETPHEAGMITYYLLFDYTRQ